MNAYRIVWKPRYKKLGFTVQTRRSMETVYRVVWKSELVKSPHIWIPRQDKLQIIFMES